MALKLMYITNDEKIAKIAEDSGVDWIFIDLEYIGKRERQGHLDTVISNHRITDITKIKKVLTKAQLLVRINPINSGSRAEIERVLADGADIIMLPFFKTTEEVQTFIDYVNGRAKVCLLLETSLSVDNLDSILNVGGIDYIHIGLNDLHICYKKKFMFELLTDGTVEAICSKINKKRIPYGFGGIARIGHGALPAEYIITEHYRLNSTMTILSRSFCKLHKNSNLKEIQAIFKEGVKNIRLLEDEIQTKSKSYYLLNKDLINNKVRELVGN